MLDTLGRQLGQSDDEIRVTLQLASPAMTGGVLVALQQPRSNHPFEEGIEGVINDCETLAALGELFRVVSCGTLEIKTNVSVIDLLPYITKEQVESMGRWSTEGCISIYGTHLWAQATGSFSMLRENMAQAGAKDDRKGEAWKFESQGLRTSFGNATMRFRDETDNWVSTERVNGFHPSYAMNYSPHISCFRQLQILTITEACGMYRGGWREETWMKSLRDSCADRAKQLQEDSRQRPSASPRPQPVRRTRTIYLPEYGEIYSGILDDVKKAVGLISDSTSLYDDLLQSRLSNLCNDANLILRQMTVESNRGWPERFDRLNETALRTAVDTTRRFSADVRGQAGHPRLYQILRRFGFSHAADTGASDFSSAVHLENARGCFLSTAKDSETLLGELLESEGAAPNSGTETDELSGLMERLEV